jgi:hypothetical protein
MIEIISFETFQDDPSISTKWNVMLKLMQHVYLYVHVTFHRNVYKPFMEHFTRAVKDKV